ARSRAARDEHEVQHLVRLAYCDPAHAVSERRLPKEKETDIFVPKESQDATLESFAQSAL
ncbi:hypothetical protein EBZ37_12660, partial [bacterium]|nr:hypothetical protein [bacterium]